MYHPISSLRDHLPPFLVTIRAVFVVMISRRFQRRSFEFNYLFNLISYYLQGPVVIQKQLLASCCMQVNKSAATSCWFRALYFHAVGNYCMFVQMYSGDTKLCVQRITSSLEYIEATTYQANFFLSVIASHVTRNNHYLCLPAHLTPHYLIYCWCSHLHLLPQPRDCRPAFRVTFAHLVLLTSLLPRNCRFFSIIYSLASM